MYPPPPIAPQLTGSIHHDGMTAIRFVIEHMTRETFPCDASACLSSDAMRAACHVAPIATARRQDESPAVLATVTQAISRIASALRIREAIEREDADGAKAPAWLAELFNGPRSDDRPNDGPMARLRTPPLPQPPQAPANLPPYVPPTRVPADCPF